MNNLQINDIYCFDFSINLSRWNYQNDMNRNIISYLIIIFFCLSQVRSMVTNDDDHNDAHNDAHNDDELNV